MNKEIIPFHKPMELLEDEQDYVFSKIEDCLLNGKLTNGENVKKLEDAISNFYSVKHAIAVSSGSMGLLLSLQSLHRKKGWASEWIYDISTPSFAWFSSLYTIQSCGLKPDFCDIDRYFWNMTTPSTDIAIPVHTFGNVSELEDCGNIIYDGAHCLGSYINDFGDATILSLAPTKIITSIEGGIILTENTELAENIIKLRDKVSRMSEIHAIFGNTFLNHITEVMNFKKDAFNYYSKNLDGIFQETDISSNHNTIGMLTDLKIPPNIETRKYYEPLLRGLKNTDYVYDKIVCLPSWYGCPYKDIVKQIQEYNIQRSK